MNYRIFLIALLLSCTSNQSRKEATLQAQVDSMEKRMHEAYAPGLGEFMNGIQLHHSKLWFAGINQNWELADFEMHEIMEIKEDIQRFCSERPEVKSMSMIEPSIDNVQSAISKKDIALFKSGFQVLTNACNECHKATSHAFNVVTIPTNPPVSNQDFKPLIGN
jgi:hypothetical protein